MKQEQLQLATSWEKVKEKIKERNPFLADEDLVYEPGKEDALLSRLAAKMDRTKEEVKQFIESISHNQDIAS